MNIKNNLDEDNLKSHVSCLKNYTQELKESPILIKEENANKKFLSAIKTTDMEEEFYFKAVKFYEKVKKTELFKLISKMPKGGLLHHHLYVHTNWEYLSALAMEEELAYVNPEEEKVKLINKDEVIPKNFINVKENRITSQSLRKYFTFEEEDINSSEYWNIFAKKIYNQFEIILNTKNFKNYITKVFNDCIDEGLLIYSGRQLFGLVKEYGTSNRITVEQETDIIIEAFLEVKKRNPLFEVNLIYSQYRNYTLEDIETDLNRCLNLKLKKKAYDDLIIGFDLLGEERTEKIKKFVQLFSDFKEKIRQEYPNMKFDYYLHSGECFSLSNDNLVDCILLKTPRIGHGTNLIRHIYLVDEFKKNDICIECNPLSNQILNYVADLRLHPIKKFLDLGLNVTINSDDDGVFGTSSLINFDFFICAVSLNFDLFDFKQTILNSINYSGVEVNKRKEIKKDFFNIWEKYIQEIIKIDNCK